MNFFSQHGQDRFLFEHFFRGKRGRRFLEVGCRDAQSSHTRAFEMNMAWRGDRIARGGADKLKEGLADAGIDCLAIGLGAADILADMDFAGARPAVITIAAASVAIAERIIGNGYRHVAKLGPDDIFKRSDVHELPQVSVICAVWNGDPKRFELLKGHVVNLERQTVKVEPIYVFDGGDENPAWLAARAISARAELTIYQAWNVALSMVATPLVMNLNLDDRLAPDAVEILVRELARPDTVAVTGDWKVCYSQAETDAVEPCYPAERLPFIREWPPKLGSFGRLGCGTHNFGTLGPVTMWRMEAHLMVARYPWRFAEGTIIRGAGDLAWWTTLANIVRGKIASVPTIIGNYHSHPSDQAEFRKPPYDEIDLLTNIGIAAI